MPMKCMFLVVLRRLSFRHLRKSAKVSYSVLLPMQAFMLLGHIVTQQLRQLLEAKKGSGCPRNCKDTDQGNGSCNAG